MIHNTWSEKSSACITFHESSISSIYDVIHIEYGMLTFNACTLNGYVITQNYILKKEEWFGRIGYKSQLRVLNEPVGICIRYTTSF